MTKTQRGDEWEVANLARCFRALADETRLALLALVSERSRPVEELVDALAITQTKASRHLAYLRRCGLVEPRRSGRHIYYRLSANHGPVGRWMVSIVRRLPRRAAPDPRGAVRAAFARG